MLSVAIHKDIAEYQPKVIGKLTGRTLISITVALGLSIAVDLDESKRFELVSISIESRLADAELPDHLIGRRRYTIIE